MRIHKYFTSRFDHFIDVYQIVAIIHVVNKVGGNMFWKYSRMVVIQASPYPKCVLKMLRRAQ